MIICTGEFFRRNVLQIPRKKNFTMNLIERTESNFKKAGSINGGAFCISFCDIDGDTGCSSSQLLGKGKLFLLGEFSRELIERKT